MYSNKIRLLGVLMVVILGVGVASFMAFSVKSSPGKEIVVSALFPEMTLEELTDDAENIVIAKVKEIKESKLKKDKEGNPLVYTDYVLKIEKDIKRPEDTNDTLVVRQLGGSAEGYTMVAEDSVELKKGERILLFVHQGWDAKTIVAGNQSKYTLVDGKAINKNASKNTTEEELIKKIKDKIKK